MTLLGHELRELLKDDLIGELNHAVFLADKITALGGEIVIRPTMPKKCKSAKEMLDQNIAAERNVIANYTSRGQDWLIFKGLELKG